ncbi:MAG: putative bifunctional diguanylate cyclase/phosphodiesterase [Thermoanaerobaculales bacterium]
MPDAGDDRTNGLLERIASLESDNLTLTDRAEDILLLGLIAEAIGRERDPECILATVLERMSILKDVPYCALGEIEDRRVNLIQEYASFRQAMPASPSFELSQRTFDALEDGAVVLSDVERNEIFSSLGFSAGVFVPMSVMLVSFATVERDRSVLLFADTEGPADRLTSLLPLFEQVIRITSERLENIFLLGDLERLNAVLEDRVRDRTGELRRTNSLLEAEIAEHRNAEEELRQAATVFESTTEGVIITAPDTTVLAVNRAFCAITGYSEQEIVGRTPRLLSSGRHDRQFYKDMWIAIRETGRWRGEIWNRRKNGEVFPELLNISVVQNESSELTHYVGVFSDISPLKESEARLEHLAHHDSLTGLPNRLLLHARLEHALARSRRTGERIAALFLDLDRFKKVNDTFGHPVGDLLLQAVALRLLGSVREDDTVARLGGDEFVIVLEGLDTPEEATCVAQKLLDELIEPFMINGRELFISGSVGISFAPDHCVDMTTLLRNADSAAYRAKAQGRGDFQVYTELVSTDAVDRFELESALRKALRLDEFVLHHQPQLSLRSGEVVGVESLIRWQHPEKGLTFPSRFIALADEIGLIERIDAAVLMSACRAARRIHDAGFPALRVAVNISGHETMLSSLRATVATVIDATGIDPRLLELEITENFILRQPELTISILHDLKELGITLAIDDFGAGYSSLSYLKRFPIDRLKIDRSFVKEIPESADDCAIVEAVISLGQNLGMSVLAEGVETEEQLDFLRQRGCDEIQGFLFARPLLEAELLQLLTEGWRFQPA